MPETRYPSVDPPPLIQEPLPAGQDKGRGQQIVPDRPHRDTGGQPRVASWQALGGPEVALTTVGQVAGKLGQSRFLPAIARRGSHGLRVVGWDTRFLGPG